MKILKIQHISKTEIILFSIIIVSSAVIFAYYLNQNVRSPLCCDELYYLYLSNNISENGILGHGDQLRTYLYPTIISFFHSFSRDIYYFDTVNAAHPFQINLVGSAIHTKLLVSLFQYATYLGTIILIANSAASRINNKLVWYSIISFGFLNPYLIQASTLFLTDILAACFVVTSVIHILNSDLSKTKNISFAMVLFFASMMIRPSSVIFLPVIIAIIFFRFVKYRNFNIVKLVLISASLSVIIFPQLYNNVLLFGHWTPLTNQNLYAEQTSWATANLKYGTVVISGQNPQLFFVSPISNSSVNSMLDLLIKDPLVFFYLFFSHIFGIIDWGYVDTYIKEFYPTTRILGSIFLYTTWFFIFYGIICFFRNKLSHPQGKVIFSFLLASAVLYFVFIATTLVEARFGYPSFLLLLPFSGIGIQRLVHSTMKHDDKKIQFLSKVGFSLILLSFILVFFYLSFLLDSQTHRIDWFTFLDSQLKR